MSATAALRMVTPTGATLYPVGTVHLRKRTHSAVASLAPAIQATRPDAVAVEYAPGTLDVDGARVSVLLAEPLLDEADADDASHTRRLDDRRRAPLPPSDLQATLDVDVDEIDWDDPPAFALLAGVDTPLLALAPRQPFQFAAAVDSWEA